jgi:hypothetical protein
MSRPRQYPIEEDAMVQVGLRLRGRLIGRIERVGQRRRLSKRQLVTLALLAVLTVDEDGNDDLRADVAALLDKGEVK